jgi:ribosomal protein L9
MANEQNLKPIRDSQRARELQEKAAEKQRENIARRKTLREELITLLQQGKTQERMSLSIIEKALNGDTKAFEVIRDTIGEKPTDKVEQNGKTEMTIKVQGDVAEWSK